MSMILGLTSLGDANIERLLADPPLVWKVIAPDDDAYESARAAAARPSLLGRLFGRPQAAEADAEPFVLADGEGETADLDKAWHGIHYLLTGTAWEGTGPLAFLVAGGRGVGDIDVGYGPARVLTSAETRSAHEALAGLRDEELRARFDAADMTRKKVYPEMWNDDDNALDYLMDNVGTLREFLAQAVAQQRGLVLYLS